jgi:hypothetical protein
MDLDRDSDGLLSWHGNGDSNQSWSHLVMPQGDNAATAVTTLGDQSQGHCQAGNDQTGNDQTGNDQTAGAALNYLSLVAAASAASSEGHDAWASKAPACIDTRVWSRKIQDVKTQLAKKVATYSGKLGQHALWPDNEMIQALYADGHFNEIIETYKAQITFVESLTNPEVGVAATPAQGRASSESESEPPPQPLTGPVGPGGKQRTKFRQAIRPRKRIRNGKNIPPSEEYFEFLVNHIRSQPAQTWCIHNLEKAYKQAHPTRDGYTTWIGNKDKETGRYTMGALISVEELLLRAFPNKTADELRSEGYLRDVKAVAAVQRSSKTYTSAEVFTFIVERMRLAQLQPESGSKDETCGAVARDVQTKWRKIPNSFHSQKILEKAWEQAASGHR